MIQKVETMRTRFAGCLEGGKNVPKNNDTARLEWLLRGKNRQRLKIMKSGILIAGVNVWQPSERAAIDVGIYLDKRPSE